jgi:ferredoxin--NADP+ reductase
MHTILDKEQLSPSVTRLEVSARRIAAIRQAGQFVIVRRGEGDERIPLTIAGADVERGSITLVIQAVGKSTRELVALEVGDAIRDVAGPLGMPTHLIASGRALCIGGGVGTAVVHPIAEALHANGINVVSIIGGRSRKQVIFEAELARLGEVLVCTDDGTHGRKGLVTDAARDVLDAGGIDIVYAVGPVPMMRAAAALTRLYKVETIVSANPLMIDGTGMCGGCRVEVAGERPGRRSSRAWMGRSSMDTRSILTCWPTGWRPIANSSASPTTAASARPHASLQMLTWTRSRSITRRIPSPESTSKLNAP